MSKPPKKRRVRRCLGRLDAQSLYTTEGCLRYAGLGRESLIEARRSGIVKPIPVGKRMYYCGDELIKWIKSQAPKEDNSAHVAEVFRELRKRGLAKRG